MIKKLLATILLSKDAIELAEHMKKEGYKIKSTKVPSLTGSHYVYERVGK